MTEKKTIVLIGGICLLVLGLGTVIGWDIMPYILFVIGNAVMFALYSSTEDTDKNNAKVLWVVVEIILVMFVVATYVLKKGYINIF